LYQEGADASASGALREARQGSLALQPIWNIVPDARPEGTKGIWIEKTPA
jgi:hypothetical protein